MRGLRGGGFLGGPLEKLYYDPDEVEVALVGDGHGDGDDVVLMDLGHDRLDRGDLLVDLLARLDHEEDHARRLQPCRQLGMAASHLALLAAGACGYPGRAHVEVAAIVEFIHTATLLHDDVVDTLNMAEPRNRDRDGDGCGSENGNM